MIEQSGETKSLDFMQLPVIEEHFLPLYPLYLACRTQCLIFYLLYHSLRYQAGILTLLIIWRSLLRIILLSIPGEISLPVYREYLRPHYYMNV